MHSSRRIGAGTLDNNTNGSYNTAVGRSALHLNVEGKLNTAVGYGTLFSNEEIQNTAVGATAMVLNTTGDSNTAIGQDALHDNTTGTNNTAVGYAAGSLATTGSGNIYLGSLVQGVAGESNTMYLGGFLQSRTFIAGVRGVTTGVPDAVAVVIDSNGQLGTVNSSRRYKEDIQDMREASSGLMKLRPVTFRYAQPYADGTKPIDYGLIAEEVEDVYPDLVAHLADGQVETVQYHKVNAMLLNEVQKQHRAIQALNDQIAAQRAGIELLKTRLDGLERQRTQQR